MIYKFEINLSVFGESSKYTKMGRACTVLAVLHKQKHVGVDTATNKFYKFYDMKSQINEFIFPDSIDVKNLQIFLNCNTN